MTTFGTGLIGHTGFVGSNLRAYRGFDALYNSTNIEDIRGARFDRLVCAGVSAVKWLANREPETDRARIARLISALSAVNAREFILVSTIDVYPNPEAEADEQTAINHAANHAYGRHRRELEIWAASHFPRAHILRLPALFGAGLRKNALYDLLRANQVEKINPLSVFQWYPLARLADDIDRAVAAGLALANLFTEPVAMNEVIARFFPGVSVGPAVEPAPRYRLRTQHAALFGGNGPWVLDGETVLDAMGRFVAAERAAGQHA